MTGDSRAVNRASSRFPAADTADRVGLVMIGGTLAPEWLLDAYRHGIFPWPIIRGIREVQWWSPDPRAIVEFDQFHVSRRLLRTCRSRRFEITSDRDFSAVIQGCATADGRAGATWLSPEMIAAYRRLFELGHAHSVEVWRDATLVGGTYGVVIGGLFAAESMFFVERDASKVAVANLVAHLRARGYQLLDIQELTPHTASLGASEIPRRDYLARLAMAVECRVEFGAIESAWIG
jgi:leucyl/phenylalanyl-tRNA---protein transferase